MKTIQNRALSTDEKLDLDVMIYFLILMPVKIPDFS
jgi:hypothetical protein